MGMSPVRTATHKPFQNRQTDGPLRFPREGRPCLCTVICCLKPISCRRSGQPHRTGTGVRRRWSPPGRSGRRIRSFRLWQRRFLRSPLLLQCRSSCRFHRRWLRAVQACGSVEFHGSSSFRQTGVRGKVRDGSWIGRGEDTSSDHSFLLSSSLFSSSIKELMSRNCR